MTAALAIECRDAISPEMLSDAQLKAADVLVGRGYRLEVSRVDYDGVTALTAYKPFGPGPGSSVSRGEIVAVTYPKGNYMTYIQRRMFGGGPGPDHLLDVSEAAELLEAAFEKADHLIGSWLPEESSTNAFRSPATI